MQRQTLKSTLIGVSEILVFMPSAVARFGESRHEALRSFIYPALLYPFILWAFSIKNPGHGADVLLFHALVSRCDVRFV